MSVLVRSYDDLYVECDTDYSKFVSNGVNYVPCTIKGEKLGPALPLLRSYISGHGVLREVRVDSINGGLRVEVPVTVLAGGKSVGEVIDALAYLLLGIRYCLTTRNA